MVRWLISLIGIGIIALGFTIEKKHPPLPTVPEQVSMQQALELVDDTFRHYIRLEADIDVANAVYSTYTKEPLYTLKPTGKTYDLVERLSVQPADLMTYAGCFLDASVPVDGRYTIALQVTTEDKDSKEKKVLQERLFAPLQGTSNRVWVLSKVFRKDDKYGADNWLLQQQFSGALSAFSNLTENVPAPELDFSEEEIQEFAVKEYGVGPANDSCVLLTEVEPFDPYCLLPVSGSDYTLFLASSSASDAVHVEEEGIITGILEPSPIKWYSDLPALLKKDVPNRIGVISKEDPVAYNKRFAASARNTKITGAVFLVLGLLMQVRKALKKR